jgi:hypothetical protein
MLLKYLRQNSVSGFSYIIDGMANIEVWEEEKPCILFGYYM